MNTASNILSKSRTVFVSSDGNDNNKGSECRPIKSINKAIDMVGDYDTVNVRGEFHIDETILFADKHNVTLEGNAQVNYVGTDGYGMLVGDNASGITIKGLALSRSTSAVGNVLGIAGKNTALVTCEVHFTNNATKHDGVKILGFADGVLIQDCDIHDCPNEAIDTVGGKNITVRGNRIYDCAHGVMLKGGAENCLIEGNQLFNMTNAAIGLGGTSSPEWSPYPYEIKDSIVRQNLIYSDASREAVIGEAIWLKGADSCLVENNTSIGGSFAVRSGGDPAQLEKHSINNVMRRNIIFRTGIGGIVVIDEDNAAELFDNCYWMTTGSGEFKINGAWYNYAQFVDQFAFDHDSIFADPLIKNIEMADFTLADGSPCPTNGVHTF